MSEDSSCNLSKQAKAYLELINRTEEQCYFLWGPVRNALLLELSAGSFDLLIELCTAGPLDGDRKMPTERHDMLYQVFGEGGQDHRQFVRDLLDEIIEPTSAETDHARSRLSRMIWKSVDEKASQMPFAGRVLERLKQDEKEQDRRPQETRKLAAQVARKLAFSEILERLMLDQDEDVRRTAVRAAVHFWREHPQEGLALLQKLGDPSAIHPLLLPSLQRLSSCFELSVSILIGGFADPVVGETVRDFWADILCKLLHLQRLPDARERSRFARLAGPLRSIILSKLLDVVIALAKRLQTAGISPYSLNEMEQFFKLLPEEKDLFGRLVPYIDCSVGSLQEIEDDLVEIAMNGDMLYSYLLVSILASHVFEHSKETTVIVRRLFERAIRAPRGLPSIPMLILTLSSACDGQDADQLDPDMIELEGEIIRRYQNVFGSVCQGNAGDQFTYSGLGSYPQYPYKKYHRIPVDVLDAFVQNARTNGEFDPDRVHDYLANNATSAGHPEYRDLEANLAALEPMIRAVLLDRDMKFEQLPPKLQTDIISALAKLRVYQRDTVDHWMSEQEMPLELQDRVRNKCLEEDPASAIIGQGVFFVRDAVLQRPEGQLGQMYIEWLAAAPECRNVSDWLGLLLQRIVNALCGVEVFAPR